MSSNNISQWKTLRGQMQPRASDLTVKGLADWVKNNTVDRDPDFQRRDRWGAPQQSRLIESFLVGIPVPPIYLKVEEDGTYTVIDGRQRLTAVSEFVDGGLRLEGLDFIKEIEGKTYSALPDDFRRALSVEPAIRAVTVGSEVNPNPEMTIEVFHRLNTGGIRLEDQEIRNALFGGPLNSLIESLARNPFMVKQMKTEEGTQGFKKMKDHEYVLRFLTFREYGEAAASTPSAHMNRYMRENRYADESHLMGLAKDFNQMVERSSESLGILAFRRWSLEQKEWRDQQNVAVFDAQSLALQQLSNSDFDRLVSSKHKIEAALKEAFADPEFDSSISGATASKKAYRYRVQRMRQAFDSVIA